MNEKPTNRNGIPQPQINRVATPIRLDKDGNKIEEEKNIQPTEVVNEVNVNTLGVNKKVASSPMVETVKKDSTPSTKVKKEHDSSTVIFILVMLIILAILCAFIFYVIIPQYIKNKNNKLIYNDAPATTEARIVEETFSTVNINNNQDVTSDGVFKVNDLYQISTVSQGNTIDVYVNNTKVTATKTLYSTIGVIDDLIIIIVKDGNVRSNRLISISKDGQVIYELKNIDEVDGMLLMSDKGSYIYNSTSLVVMTSRIEGKTLILDNNLGSVQGLDVCNEEEMRKNSIANNFMVMATYSIQYLGNHQFGKPIKMFDVTLNNYKETNHLCN